ncbi:MAG: succinate dehydrogenase cytochrome b subunit [Myxococcales bacterium]|jgi:succinate dehydrogenase / fumarate reductase cytochrome b subunit|nr:succinate dehydrogenase cytochrome b subunit [Myxococcales bacterium]
MIKALSFSDTTIGKKVLMAVSGLVLFGFVIGHMLGNLQVFLGPKVYNDYGVALRDAPLLLWGVRILLLVSFLVHIAMAMQLSALSRAARPVGYKMRKDAITTFAARTMLYSGVLVLLFVLYHLAHFTFPGVAMGAYEHSHTGDVYSNFVNGFSIPWVVALYVAAQVALGLHIYHGAWSLLQTFGLNNPLRNATLHGGARTLALVVVVGNILLPLSVLLGLVQ